MRFLAPLPSLLLLLPSALAVSPTTDRNLTITNNCTHAIWPGILSSNGSATTSGFFLDPNSKRSITVSWDWVGRIWGRTNCTFDSTTNTGHCLTGDCGGRLECEGAGVPPTTLAEFTISGKHDMTFFDVSLVDGYDLDMSIVPEYDGAEQPRSGNSPVCVMSTPTDDWTTTHWCPFDHLLFPPAKHPHDSVAFWYPDDHLSRPLLSPCLSACAKWNRDRDCCAGDYNDPDKCKPSLYSKRAKKVCPDAYSYAYDDLLSTFTVPTGGGFEVAFCPGGESSDIMTSRGVTGAAAGRGRGKVWAVAVAVVVGVVAAL